MTEKDYAPQRNEGKKMVVNTPKEKIEKAPVKKAEKPVEKKEETKKIVEDKEKPVEKKEDAKKGEEKSDEKKEDVKPKAQTKPKVKKTEAFVNETSIPISTKHSMAVCKFIKGKKIEDAINDLGQVALKKKAVPMKGEIPHRKGMMSGRYPKKAAEHFIKILKRLEANAIVNGLENTIITEAIANFGSRPYGRFGRVRKKRTHLKITVKVKKENKTKGKIKKETEKSNLNKEAKKE